MSVLLVYCLGLQLVLGGLAQTAPRVVPPCPPGWHEVADLVTCIKLVQQPMTWYDARDVCQGDGGDLVKVENSVMGDFILNVTDRPIYQYWIGLNVMSEEGIFRWLDNKDQATYILSNQNQGGLYHAGSEDEDCVVMRCDKKGNCGAYEVWLCGWICSFICEKPQFIFADVPAPHVTSTCPNGWDESVFSGTCIKRVLQDLNWWDARKECQAHGGDLIKFENQYTLDFIASFHSNADLGDYWIGLNDIKTEGRVHWLDDETDTPVHLAWKEAPPSNSDIYNCVHMEFEINWKQRRVWSFANCNQKRKFICEKHLHLITHVSARQLGRGFLCPRGWIRSSRTGTCVKLFHDKKSWDDARDSCKARGGDLVKVVDFSMNKLVINQILTLGGGRQYSYGDNYWIGLRALAQRNEFQWLDGESKQDDSELAYFGQKGRLKRKAVSDQRKRWYNKTVPYKIQHGIFDPAKRKNITEAIKHWEKFTCIKFRHSDSFVFKGPYLLFKGGKCRAQIGMLPLAKSQRVEVGGCITIRGIIHEIGHIIGFYHEFIRPDRDRYVYISDNLVRSQPNNYRKINSIDTFNLPFDYHSVMNYYNLITHDRAYQDIIGRGQGLSFLDIKLANQMYKCSEDCKPRPLCPNEGFVDKDCKCYCKGKPGGEPIELCNIFNVTQPKFTPWSPDFSHDINNTCVEISITRVPTGSWRNAKCDTKNKYICQRPQLSSGQIAESYLPLMKKVGKVLCRDGWTRIPGSGTCIKLFDKLRTWAEARAECKAKSGDLVKIVDEGMDDIIMDNVAHRGNSNHWIGLNAQKMTGSSHWLDEVGKPNYTNYEETKPGCYAITAQKWVAFSCSANMYFICERITAHPSPERLTMQLNLTTDWEVISERIERNLSINCSADIAGVPSDVTNIQRLQMSLFSESMGVVHIADVRADSGNVVCLMPQNCTLDFHGEPRNLRELEIYFKIPEAQCFDGGYYQCVSTYQDERAKKLYNNLTATVVTSKGQLVTIKAPIENLNLSVEPFKTDNIYNETDRVVLTCSVDVRYIGNYSDKADFRKDAVQFEFEWRKGPAEGNIFYKEYRDVRTKPEKSVAGGDQCSVTRTSTFTIKGKSSAPATPVDIFPLSPRGATHHSFVKVSQTRKKAVSHLFWCSAKYGDEVVYSTRLNITTLEEADKQSILLAEIRSPESTRHVLINCNADAVELPLQFSEISGLQITRQRMSNNEGFEKILDFYPYYPVGVKKDSYIHEGRNWKFDLDGVLLDPTFSRNLSIRWVINDPVCDDNGIYQCTVTYVRDGLTLKHSRQQELKMESDMRRESCDKETIKSKRPASPAIRNPSNLSTQDVIQVGRPLEILCNTTELGQTRRKRTIIKLTLSRQVEGSGNMSDIATYGKYSGMEPFSFPPRSRPNWNITFIRRSKELEIDGPQPGFIKWVIKNPQLEDAGVYQCGVFFYDKSLDGFNAFHSKGKKMPHISKISASSRTHQEQFMMDLSDMVFYFQGQQYLPARDPEAIQPKRPALPAIRNPSKLSNQDVIQVGRPLEILCDTTELGHTQRNKTIIKLTVSRQVRNGNMSDIATFGIYPRIERFTVPPRSRPNWNITFIRRSKELEIDGPQPGVIKWVIKNPQLEDAGVYQCGVFFYDKSLGGFNAFHSKGKKMPHISKISASSRTHQEQFMMDLSDMVFYFQGQQYLPARAGARNLHLTLTPSDANDEHLENDIVSVTCSVEGAHNLKINLRPVSSGSSLQIVSSKHLSIQEDERGYWKHKSTMILKLRAAGSYTVLCDAHHNQWTEFSTKLTVHVLKACSAFRKYCLPSAETRGIHQRMFPTASELHLHCQHNRWRKSKCLDILRGMDCRFGGSRIQKSKLAQELYAFHCSTKGKMLLAEMNNSVCSRDRGLFQDMLARLEDAGGSLRSDMRSLRYRLLRSKFRHQTKTAKEALCEYTSSGRTNAVSQAEHICGEAVGKYVDYIYRVKDHFWYDYCQDCIWGVQQCGNRILGFDLSGNTTYNWITQNTDNMIQMCSLWKRFESCYKGYKDTCVDDDYKWVVHTETTLMDIACSHWGKQIRISPCKRGMDTYTGLEEDSLRFCHSHLKLGANKRQECSVLEGRLKCFVVNTKFNSGCGKSLELYIARKLVVNDMIHYNISDCKVYTQPRSSVERCPLICEDILPDFNAMLAPQPFRVSWISVISKKLDFLCRNDDRLRACWNIREVLCPDVATQEHTSNWNDVLGLVCWNKTRRPEMASVLRTCINQAFVYTGEERWKTEKRLNARVTNCQKDLNSKIRTTSSISHMGSDCKLIEESEKCILQLFQEAGGSWCKQLVSQIWPIFLRDDVAAVRKRCYADCPEGWSLAPDANNCIRVFKEKKTWFEARHSCGESSDLVKIEDPSTSFFITGLTTVIPTNPIVFWIGLNDRKVEGEYRWLDEISKFTDSGASNLGDSSSEDCVTMSGSLWVVSECNAKHSYICEQPSLSRCWETLECVRTSVEQHIETGGDRIIFIDFLQHTGARHLATICSNLTECFAQHEPLCKYTKSLRYVKGFMDNFCSTVGWDLIAKANRSSCFPTSISFNMTQQTNRYENSLRKIGKGENNPTACREVTLSLYEILQETRAQCDIHLASFLTQVVRYKLNYQDNKCVDLKNGCWQLRSCLMEFTESPPAIAEFDWVLMFNKISYNRLNKLCTSISILRKCHKDHGHVCRNNTFVDNVKTAINLLNHLCNNELTDQRTQFQNHRNFLKAMSYLREKCVVGLHESLTSRDKTDLEEHYVDAFPHLSEDLCRRIEQTGTDCVSYVSSWSGDRDNNGDNNRFWLNIWLVVMGDKLSSARDTCHGVSACPLWSMRKPNGSTCLVLRGYEDTYENATAQCVQNGGNLINITDINMMGAISDFITRKVSVLKLGRPQYAFWINDRSPWKAELFSTTEEKVLPIICKSTLENFWHPVNGKCTEKRAFVVCEEPIHCKVKSACPTGWTLSPDGEACLRVADSRSLRANSDDVCRKDGTYLAGFENKQIRRIIYDLLPLNHRKSFWVRPVQSREEFYNDFTKNKAYNKSWGVRLSWNCAQMNIKLPMKVKIEDCSHSARALCYIEPIRCNTGKGRLTKPRYTWWPTTQVKLNKAECEAGSFRVNDDDLWCVRIDHEQLTWHEARARCRIDGQDLLDTSRDSWESFFDRLGEDGATHYWVHQKGPAKLTAAPCRLLHLVDHVSGQKWQTQEFPAASKSCDTHQHAFICEKAVSKSASDKCPKSMIVYQDICLDLEITTPKTWTGAREDCRRNGGDLVKIASTDERKKYFIEGLANELNSGSLWLGLRQERGNDQFKWLDDNTTMKLGTFGGIKYRVHDKSESLCLTVQPSVDNGKPWQLEKCTSTGQYICEYHAFGTHSEEPCEPGWLQMDRSSCIRLYTEELTWSEGRDRCQEKGGNLVDYVTSNKRWQFLSERPAFNGAYWVGITEAGTQTKGECRAIRQQSPNQLIMETATGKSCSKHRDGFICERTAYYSVSDEPALERVKRPGSKRDVTN